MVDFLLGLCILGFIYYWWIPPYHRPKLRWVCLGGMLILPLLSLRSGQASGGNGAEDCMRSCEDAQADVVRWSPSTSECVCEWFLSDSL